MCGIVGVISNKSSVPNFLYEALFHLQHRGQHSSGIATLSSNQKFLIVKKLGILENIIPDVSKLSGNIGIGQLRYPTSGLLHESEIQPFRQDNIVLCHNGNISNYEILTKNLSISLSTKSDSELILQLFSQKLKSYGGNINDDIIKQIIVELSNILKGSYSVVMLIQNFGLVAFKDPHGIKPLVFGSNQSKNTFIISSESVSITCQNYDFAIIDEIQAGEVVIFHQNLKSLDPKRYIYNQKELKPCIFEWIYTMRAESIFQKICVYEARLKMGEYLAHKIRKELKEELKSIDLIIPVPETSKPVATRMAEVLGIQYRDCILKNRYIGRTFIMDNQKMRKKNIQRKLGVIRSIIEGKNILIVDDSIVRGNTMKHIVELLRKNNVNKLYVASCAPPIRYQNVYGIDLPTKKELIASGKTINEIGVELGVDKLIYLDINGIQKALCDLNPKLTTFEMSMFTGKYLD